MTHRSFTAIYEEDPEGGFVVSVPVLRGRYSQGKTLDESERSIAEAITAYLKSVQAAHQQLPIEYNVWQGRVAVAV